MRNLILGAVAALAVCAVPGLASAQSGYIDLSYARSNLDGGGLSEDLNNYSANGVVALDAGALGIQLGAGYTKLDPEDAGDGADDWHADAHLYSRNATWQWGGGVGYSHLDGTGDNVDEWAAALEMKFFQARTTYGASLSYSDVDNGNAGLDLKGWNLDGDVRHFVSDNFALAGNVGVGTIDAGSSDNNTTWNAGVGAEYQFSSMPISVFGGYEHSSIDIDPSSVDTDTYGIGIRYNFGGSLFDRDRSGANLHAPRGAIARLFGV